MARAKSEVLVTSVNPGADARDEQFGHGVEIGMVDAGQRVMVKSGETTAAVRSSARHG